MTERKILIITNRVPFPLRDGGNIAVNAMIEGYHGAGWQVFLLAMNTSRHVISHEQLGDLFKHLYAFEWVDVNNNLNFVQLAKNYFFSKEPEHAERFYKKNFEEKILEVLASFNPDVVQVESVYLTTYMPAIKEYSDALTVLRMHNIEFQIWQGLANKTQNKLKEIYLNNLSVRVRDFEREAWKDYDLLLPITEKDAYLVTRMEDVNDILVTPFSIDIDTIKPGRNERWVGYHIGAMDWMSNLDGMRWFLKKAWPRIRRAAPKFEFYFAGRNMPAEFKQLKINGVHCLDEVPSSEDFIEDKKILIVPLWSGGGIRVKILEAMAAGKVVISTRVGIRGIEAKPLEHYLLVHKPEDFARAVKWCFENKEAAEKMAQNARALVAEKYEHKKVMKLVTDEIDMLLGNQNKMV